MRRWLLRHAERLAVDPTLELEADADDVGAVGADGRGGDRGRHVKHPGTLPQGVVVGVDVLLRGLPLIALKPLVAFLCQLAPASP